MRQLQKLVQENALLQGEVQTQLLATTCICWQEMTLLYYETAFKFLDYLTEKEGVDFSALVSMPAFWAIWKRKWNETDRLFLERLQNKSTKVGYRITDNMPQQDSKQRQKSKIYGEYLSPFYYKEKFESEDEVIIFSIDEMLYHYKTLHECDQVMTWAMASLVHLYKFCKT